MDETSSKSTHISISVYYTVQDGFNFLRGVLHGVSKQDCLQPCRSPCEAAKDMTTERQEHSIYYGMLDVTPHRFLYQFDETSRAQYTNRSFQSTLCDYRPCFFSVCQKSVLDKCKREVLAGFFSKLEIHIPSGQEPNTNMVPGMQKVRFRHSFGGMRVKMEAG